MFKQTLAELTKNAGLPENPLPKFTEEEKKLNKGIFAIPILLTKKLPERKILNLSMKAEHFKRELSPLLSCKPNYNI